MSTGILTEQIKRHEGFRSYVYTDTTGHKTIGYGFNLDAGITERDAEALLQSQLAGIWLWCNEEFNHFWWRLSHARQGVIINMVFNLGRSGFKKFKKMIKAIEDCDDEAVVNEMLDSKWAHQVKGRAWELADQWRDNDWQIPKNKKEK